MGKKGFSRAVQQKDARHRRAREAAGLVGADRKKNAKIHETDNSNNYRTLDFINLSANLLIGVGFVTGVTFTTHL